LPKSGNSDDYLIGFGKGALSVGEPVGGTGWQFSAPVGTFKENQWILESVTTPENQEQARAFLPGQIFASWFVGEKAFLKGAEGGSAGVEAGLEGQQELGDDWLSLTWANLSPMSTINNFESIGEHGTFITPLSTFEAVIGKIDPAATEITISPEQARMLEFVLGKREGSLEETNMLSLIDDISWRSPRSPTIGTNPKFMGAGKGLPEGASELVIDSLPSSGGGGVRQIVIKVGK
jgi:hypothetical protein